VEEEENSFSDSESVDDELEEDDEGDDLYCFLASTIACLNL